MPLFSWGRRQSRREVNFVAPDTASAASASASAASSDAFELSEISCPTTGVVIFAKGAIKGTLSREGTAMPYTRPKRLADGSLDVNELESCIDEVQLAIQTYLDLMQQADKPFSDPDYCDGDNSLARTTIQALKELERALQAKP